jgi:outer membrane murein-binding lipoprotein Lpp
MKKMIIVATAGLAVGLAGCASEYKQEAKQEQAAKNMPVNCATAKGDIAMLQGEKESAASQAAEGVSAFTPAGAVAGFITGTEGEKAQMASGDYNKALDQAITRIKTTCGIN